jgi:hypothetical protein
VTLFFLRAFVSPLLFFLYVLCVLCVSAFDLLGVLAVRESGNGKSEVVAPLFKSILAINHFLLSFAILRVLCVHAFDRLGVLGGLGG